MVNNANYVKGIAFEKRLVEQFDSYGIAVLHFQGYWDKCQLRTCPCFKEPTTDATTPLVDAQIGVANRTIGLDFKAKTKTYGPSPGYHTVCLPKLTQLRKFGSRFGDAGLVVRNAGTEPIGSGEEELQRWLYADYRTLVRNLFDRSNYQGKAYFHIRWEAFRPFPDQLMDWMNEQMDWTQTHSDEWNESLPVGYSDFR